jgi:5-methylthioadenosine/S-adenosylhomocysteine deaminase
MQHEVGALSEGMKADIVLLDLDTLGWTPLNDPKKHLVFCESGSSVDTSIVDGRLIMEGGKIKTLNVPDVAAELCSMVPEFRANLSKAQNRAHRLWPCVDEIYYRVARTSTGLNRWTENEDAWIEQSLPELLAGESSVGV